MKRNRWASYFAAISITATLGVPVARAELIHQGDFETNNLSQFKADQLPKSDSGTIVSSPRREGGKALKILLRKGDAPGRERAEVMPKAYSAFPGFKNNYTIGQEYWYAISMYLPADMVYDTDSETVFQFHAAPDLDLGEDHIVPPLSLTIEGSKWLLKSRGDSRKVLYKSTKLQFDKRFSLGDVKRGDWTDWVFRVKWSYGDDGIIQIWKDGQLVLDRKGMNCYNDALGPYLKLGIYKHGWIKKSTLTTKRVMYFDALRIYKGTTTVQGMMPSGTPDSSVPGGDAGGGPIGEDTDSGSTGGIADGGSTGGIADGGPTGGIADGGPTGGIADGGVGGGAGTDPATAINDGGTTSGATDNADDSATGDNTGIEPVAAMEGGAGGGGAEAPFYLYLLAIPALARSRILRGEKAWRRLP